MLTFGSLLLAENPFTAKINEPTGCNQHRLPALTNHANKEHGMAAKQPTHAHAAQQQQPRDTIRLAEMHQAYLDGASLSQVGDKFGITRQSVFNLFKYHGLPTRAKVRLEAVEFNGHTYSPNTQGYWRRTDGDRTLLHRDVWQICYGEIPDGFEVHHKDENKSNNCIDNLECLPGDEHTRLHNPLQPLPEKACEFCGSALVRRINPNPFNGTYLETPSALAKRRFCDQACRGKWLRGRPRGGGQ